MVITIIGHVRRPPTQPVALVAHQKLPGAEVARSDDAPTDNWWHVSGCNEWQFVEMYVLAVLLRCWCAGAEELGI